MRADMKDRLAVSRRVAEFHATPEGRALYRRLNEGDGIRIVIALETDTLTQVHKLVDQREGSKVLLVTGTPEGPLRYDIVEKSNPETAS